MSQAGAGVEGLQGEHPSEYSVTNAHLPQASYELQRIHVQAASRRQSECRKSSRMKPEHGSSMPLPPLTWMGSLWEAVRHAASQGQPPEPPAASGSQQQLELGTGCTSKQLI